MRKRLEIALLTLAVLAVLIGTHAYIAFYTPADRNGEVRIIDIPKGTSFRVIADNLEKEKIIRNSETFTLVADVLGAYKKVKAGEYELSGALTPMEVLEILVKGRVKKHFVTIPEGLNIREIAAALKSAGLMEEQEFIEKATDARFVSSLGVEGPTLEGYLFPDTYSFTKGMTADEIAGRMVERFKSVYFPELDGITRARGLTMKKVVTLASIIEKETGAPGERPLIAAVFMNRLRKGMKLQSDPTVIYDIKGFDGNITKKHLVAKTPYNTYANYGLPPGPIANPGKASLDAALNPANEDYLYFVSRNDGTHKFSKNLIDHNRAVREFQKARAVAQGGRKS